MESSGEACAEPPAASAVSESDDDDDEDDEDDDDDELDDEELVPHAALSVAPDVNYNKRKSMF